MRKSRQPLVINIPKWCASTRGSKILQKPCQLWSRDRAGQTRSLQAATLSELSTFRQHLGIYLGIWLPLESVFWFLCPHCWQPRNWLGKMTFPLAPCAEFCWCRASCLQCLTSKQGKVFEDLHPMNPQFQRFSSMMGPWKEKSTWKFNVLSVSTLIKPKRTSDE